MKFRFNSFLLMFVMAACHAAVAQTAKLPVNEPEYNKPRVFADLPERAVFRLADASRLLDVPVGASVNALLAPGLLVKGTVVSKSQPDNNLQSVVVKTTTRGGAVLTFARIKNADGSFLYRGRMMGKAAGDALELVREGAAYVFRKRGYYDLVNE